jgi:putative transposase
MARPKSNRRPVWDYSEPAVYYVTISTHLRRHVFGEVRSSRIHLNDCGEIAHEEWERTSSLRTDAYVDHFIVMPDHVHALIVILAPGALRDDVLTGTGYRLSHAVIERRASRIPIGGRRPSSLASILRGYKSAVTSRIRMMKPELRTLWQPNYWDRVVRTEAEWAAFSAYISDNPRRWSEKYGC